MFKTQTAIFIKNISVNLLVEVWLILLTFLFTPFIIKTLGPAKFGILVLAKMISGYGLLIDFGLPVALVKYFAEKLKQKEEKELFFSGFLLLFFVGLTVGLFLFLISKILAVWVFHLDKPFLKEAILIFQLIAIDVFFDFLIILPGSFLQARQRFELASLKNLFYGTAATLGYAILLKNGASLKHLIMLNIFITLFTTATLFALVDKFFGVRLSLVFSLEKAKKLLRFGAFRLFTNLNSFLNNNIGKTLLGIFYSSTLVSFFTIPSQIIQRVLGLRSHITMALLPVISKKIDEPDKIEEIFNKTTVLTSILIIPMLSFLTFNSFKLLALWLSPELARECYLVLVVLSLGAIVNSITAIPCVVAEGLGNPEIVSKFSGFNTLITLPASLILIVFYKGLGAALASGLGTIIQAPIFILLVIKKFIKNNQLRVELVLNLIKIVLFSLVLSFLISYFIKDVKNLFIIFPIFIIYFAANFLMFLLTKTIVFQDFKRIIKAF